MILRLYRITTHVVSPLLPGLLMRRERRGKEDPTRIPERLGHPGAHRAPTPLLWIHAASMGEAASVVPLMHEVATRYPYLHQLLTTGTVTSAQVITPRLPARAQHQFVPVDTPAAVKRFIRHWQPDAAWWVESELWPNLVMEMHSSGKPMALLNARMSPRSFARWRKLQGSIAKLLRAFQFVLAQSEEDKQRLEQLGARHVQFVGNLKYDTPPLECDDSLLAALKTQIGDRPVWLAASTHPGEEEQILAAHKALLPSHPHLLTIIVPRHANRGKDIAVLTQTEKLPHALRSAGEAIQQSTHIYIADTMGELGLFYRLSPIVFVGGSLVPHGGQNPLEPARLGAAILVGPHVTNFQPIIDDMLASHACISVQTMLSLSMHVSGLLEDTRERSKYSHAALAFAQSRRGAIGRMLAILAPQLETMKGAEYANP